MLPDNIVEACFRQVSINSAHCSLISEPESQFSHSRVIGAGGLISTVASNPVTVIEGSGVQFLAVALLTPHCLSAFVVKFD